jgi:hypothetical protein
MRSPIPKFLAVVSLGLVAAERIVVADSATKRWKSTTATHLGSTENGEKVYKVKRWKNFLS